ncbi:hypothetical protein ACO0QE_001837 [Hanseniaspora vineae]
MGNTDSKLNIYKQHILLLANADIVIPLYQQKSHSATETSFTSNDHGKNHDYTQTGQATEGEEDEDIASIQSDGLDSFDDDEVGGEGTEGAKEREHQNPDSDPYNDFFNCIVETTQYLSFADIDKSINNNELKYIFYSNPTNFTNLLKFLCYKIIRIVNSISKTASSISSGKHVTTNHNFEFQIRTLLTCVRILTKIMPIFFELCYNDINKNHQLINEDSIFWEIDTAESNNFELNSLNENNSLSESLNGEKHPQNTIADALNSLKVDMTYKNISALNKNSSSTTAAIDESSESITESSDDKNDGNTTVLGICLLSSLLKSLFMEGFTLPLEKNSRKGYISFQLWENGITSSSNDYVTLSPTLDANRLEILRLVEVLCSNCLYSELKIDNKFLASWCCCMPEYLSIYLLSSLTNVLLRSCHYLKNDYPPEYTIVNDIRLTEANNLQLLKTNTAFSNHITQTSTNGTYSHLNDFPEAQVDPTISHNNNNASISANEKIYTLSDSEATQLRETFIKIATQILTIYFQFYPNALSSTGEILLRHAMHDQKDWSLYSVAQRFINTIQKEADFKKILISFNKILKYPMNAVLESENNLFNLNSKKFNIFGYFKSGSNASDKSNNTNKDNGSNGKPAGNNQLKNNTTNSSNTTNNTPGTDEQGSAQSDLPDFPENFNSVLLIFWEFMKSNKLFEKFIIEKYSNKLFMTLVYYLANYSSNQRFKTITIPLISQFALYMTSCPLFLFKSMHYIQSSYYAEKLPDSYKIIAAANISSTTYRDFAIIHLSRIALRDVQHNAPPKAHIYEMLYNMLLAIPSFLQETVCSYPDGDLALRDLIKTEAVQNSNQYGSFMTGISYSASAQCVQLIYKSSNKQYLTSSANPNATTKERPPTRPGLRSAASNDSIATINENESVVSYAPEASSNAHGTNEEKLNASAHCNHVVNFLINPGIITVNNISKKPYLYTPAAKIDNMCLILRNLSYACINHYKDCRNLLFALTKYDKVMMNLKQVLQEINVDIEKQIEPLLLKDVAVPTNSKRLPYDLCVNTVPILTDEILYADNDFLNNFDPDNDDLLKSLTLRDLHKEDAYYTQGNTYVYFTGPEASFAQSLHSQQRRSSQQGTAARLDHSASSSGPSSNNQSKNSSANGGSQFIFQHADIKYQPDEQSNLVYHVTRSKRPYGLANRRKKKLVIRSSDKLRQPLLPTQTNHYWFLGEPFFEILFKLVQIIGAKFPRVSLLQGSQYHDIISQIAAKDKEVLKEIQTYLPFGLKQAKGETSTLLKVNLNDGGVAQQWLHTLVWMDIFNLNSIEYQSNTEQMSEHSDLLELSRTNTLHSLNTCAETTHTHNSNHHSANHSAKKIAEEDSLPPSSPMLEKWMSRNSLSRTNSNTSFINNVGNNENRNESARSSFDFKKQDISSRQTSDKSNLGPHFFNSHSTLENKSLFPPTNEKFERKSSSASSSSESQGFFSFGWKPSKTEAMESQEKTMATRDASPIDLTKKRPLVYTVDQEILNCLVWNNTGVAMFDIVSDKREEFSLMDMTSSLLNKFKFKNNVSENADAHSKMCDEVASMNLRNPKIQGNWTPRSSVSSISSQPYK